MSQVNPVADVLFHVPEEQSYDVEVEGRLPDYVKGTFYFNGPALFRKGTVTYRNWLDADGMVRALRLIGEEGRYTSRFLNSLKFQRERAAGRCLYRTFGTAFYHDILRRGVALESPINAGVLDWGGRLLAFGEHCLPLELDANSLETIGAFDFGGSLDEMSPLSAFPRFNGNGGGACNFGMRYLRGETRLSFYEFDDERALSHKVDFEFPEPHYIRDFAVTDELACFYLSPYMLNTETFIRRKKSILESLEWKPERESELLVVSRQNYKILARLPLGHGQIAQYTMDATLRGDHLIVDAITGKRPIYDQYHLYPGMFTNLSPAICTRIVVDTRSWRTEVIAETGLDLHLDFPCVKSELNTIDHAGFWAVGVPIHPHGKPKFYDRLLRFRWKTRVVDDVYITEPGVFLCGQPVIVLDPCDQKKGVAISQVWAAEQKRSAYYAFDAFNLKAGPIAVINLKTIDPLGFYGTFVSDSDKRG